MFSCQENTVAAKRNRMSRRAFFLSAAAFSALTLQQASASSAQVRRFYVDSQFGQLHGYRAQPTNGSNKTPLVCLHQTPSSARIFEKFIAVMGQDRLAIAFDNPGYGASDGPIDRVPLETYASTIAEALETLGFGLEANGQVDMLGMLTGAKISGELARSRPDLVRRLILVQSLVMPKEQRLAMKTELEGNVLDGWKEQGADFYITRLKSALSGLDPEQTVDQAVADFADSLVGGEDYLRGGMTALAYPAEQLYKEISQPTLVVTLSDERSELASGAAAIIPGAMLLNLPNQSRHTFRADPENMALHVRSFLDYPPPDQ